MKKILFLLTLLFLYPVIGYASPPSSPPGSGSNTNANTICTGTTTYLDGEGNCDDISAVYEADDAELGAIAGLTSAADKLPYYTGSGTASLADFSAYIRTLTGSANEAAFKATANLEAGTDFNAYHAYLNDVAGLSPTTGDIIYFNGSNWVILDSGTANYVLQANGAAAPSWTNSLSISAIDLGSGTFDIPNTASDAALADAGKTHLNTTDEQLCFHSAADGEISGEACISLLDHITVAFDPAYMYDQESTYRSVPLPYLGDNFPEGFTIVEWKVAYVGGDPTTELDADIICDTTPDFNTAAGATVMDVIDTTAGAATADTGFDSGTCANGSQMYIHFGADPTDANVFISVDIWGYGEED